MNELKLYFKKEYLLSIKNNLKSYKDRIFSFIFNLIVALFLITLLTFIFVELNERFIYYNASKEMFIFGEVIINLFVIYATISHINKSIFNKEMYDIDKTLPLDNRKLIAVKLVFTYIKSYFSFIVLFLPIFIGYGITLKMGASYYILGIFLSLFYNLFNLFISSLLSFPIIYLKEFIKKHSLLLFIGGIILLALFAFIYYTVFNIFIDILTNSRIEEIFNIETVASFKHIISFFEISNLFITSFVNTRLIFGALTILVGLISLVASYFLLYYYYKYKEVIETINDSKVKASLKTHSVFYSLVKKEVTLLFRNTSYLFSYLILLLFSPLLIYLISFPLKNLVVSYIGELENIYVLLIYLVSTLLISLISINGSFIISRENGYFKTFKLLPIKMSTQINVKYLINISFILFINLINFLVISLSGLLSLNNSLFVFIFTLLSTLFLAISLMNYDIKKPYITATLLKDYSDLKIYSLFIFVSLIYPLIISAIGLVAYIYVGDEYKNLILALITLLMLFISVMDFISIKGKMKKEAITYYEK